MSQVFARLSNTFRAKSKHKRQFRNWLRRTRK